MYRQIYHIRGRFMINFDKQKWEVPVQRNPCRRRRLQLLHVSISAVLIPTPLASLDEFDGRICWRFILCLPYSCICLSSAAREVPKIEESRRRRLQLLHVSISVILIPIPLSHLDEFDGRICWRFNAKGLSCVYHTVASACLLPRSSKNRRNFEKLRQFIIFKQI